jgi:hypothetical protein
LPKSIVCLYLRRMNVCMHVSENQIRLLCCRKILHYDCWHLLLYFVFSKNHLCFPECRHQARLFTRILQQNLFIFQHEKILRLLQIFQISVLDFFFQYFADFQLVRHIFFRSCNVWWFWLCKLKWNSFEFIMQYVTFSKFVKYKYSYFQLEW